MVRRYDLASADPVSKQLLHRVSHYLLGTDSGQLGPDFRGWASDGQMSAGLRAEITAYQLCVLDDSFVESPHALVSRTARQSTLPSPSWWSSSVRFEQNFADYDSAARDALGSSNSCSKISNSSRSAASRGTCRVSSGCVRRKSCSGGCTGQAPRRLSLIGQFYIHSPKELRRPRKSFRTWR